MERRAMRIMMTWIRQTEQRDCVERSGEAPSTGRCRASAASYDGHTGDTHRIRI